MTYVLNCHSKWCFFKSAQVHGPIFIFYAVFCMIVVGYWFIFSFLEFSPDELRQALMPTLEKLYRQDPESLPFRQPVDPVLLQIPVSLQKLTDPKDKKKVRIHELRTVHVIGCCGQDRRVGVVMGTLFSTKCTDNW